MSPSTMLRTSHKKKQQQPTRTLTLAQRIDVAIRAAAIARAEREAAERHEEDRKKVVVGLAQRHGTPDGDSWRLRGRDYHCIVTSNQPIAIEHKDWLSLPKKWRSVLTVKVLAFRPTVYLRDLIRRRSPRRGLPKTIRRFLRGVKGDEFITLRFDGRRK